MISAACAQLGERGLVCSAATDFSDVNFAAVFPPAARSSITARRHDGHRSARRGSRVDPFDRPRSDDRGARIKRLKVGTARRFSRTTQESLVADLRTVLAPQYLT